MGARSLKSLIIRANQKNETSAALFFKERISSEMAEHILENINQTNIALFYSDHRCPASVPTELLCQKGCLNLTEELLGKTLTFSALGFFQVNLPVFEVVLKDINCWINKECSIIDLFCGVGTISIALSDSIRKAVLVESDKTNTDLISENLKGNNLLESFTSYSAPAENVLNIIETNATLIIDPPRAGLHTKITEEIILKKPVRIIYLACNPSTQARDCELLSPFYKPMFFKLYNFFPGTPHVESLIIMDRI